MDQSQTKIYFAVLITAVVVGTIIIYFIISLLRQNRMNLELHKKNVMAEIAGLEKDRARIATDLHDEIAPLVAAIKLNMNSFDLSKPEDIQLITISNKHFDTLMKRLREISFGLMPNSLIRKGLIVGLEELINYVHIDQRVTYNFRHADNFTLDKNMSINIYRIVQESIHNSLKHANPKTINISLNKIAGKLILEISDDGPGFDHEMVLKESTGFGLRSMLSRTQMMRGDMFIETKEGEGSHFIFEIPLQ